MKITSMFPRIVACVVLTAVFASPLALADSAMANQDRIKNRQEVYTEIQSMFGLVPSFFKTIPDETIGLEWELMKRTQMTPGPIPNKYRELLGIAVSAATKCHYCIYFHTEAAKLNGATSAEIEDALHYAKSTQGWSTYINGSQIDMETFRKEVDSMVAYAKAQAEKAKSMK